VHEALYRTPTTCIRRSCVTVFTAAWRAIYHVDIAIYSDKAYNTDGKSYTAKGKTYSPLTFVASGVIPTRGELTIVIFAGV